MSERTAAGHLFVVSAPSGAGKTSLVRALVARTGRIGVSVSHTTRSRREGETNGVDYHFVDAAEFARMAAAGEFLEHATVFDHAYGTSRSAVAGALEQGIDVILEIDWQGARSIRAAAPDAISIFVLPPSVEELERRLRGRGDAESVIARRMRDAVREISHYGEYDYLVVNDDFEGALAALTAIVGAARLRRGVQELRHAGLLAALVAP
ncbi:MAG: guanylate kinase [Gammaproteobacteria bacterium]